MSELRKLVLDVLKPHEPDITVLARRVSELESIDGVNVSVYEIDQKVENVKLTVEGRFNDFEEIKKVILDIGATIHSIDEVVAGKRIIFEEETLHDREKE
ncbi:MAG: hypothetical protein GF334_12900 [Candidatus Altiarchaeales archaeon]|nr:hypothetical protein [Candidatus Altiarchaeales archaeon]